MSGSAFRSDSTPAAIADTLSVGDYHRLARTLDADAGSLQPLGVAILSSCNLEFIRPFLVVEGARAGFSLSPTFGPFGQIEQQIIDRSSSLHRAAPDAVVMVLRPEDISPDHVFRPSPRDDVSARTRLLELVGRIGEAVERLRATSAVPVLVANFAEPAVSPLGPFEANAPDSLAAATAEANVALRERLAQIPNAIIWDLAGLVRRVGSANWHDPRLWAMARVPVRVANQPTLAAHLVRTLRATQRPPAKCIVLDLDNTLWGGVIGDDGLSGIQLGDDFPGNAFKSFQRALLGLADRGVLLAVASKNDSAVVEEVFRRHPEMLIRWEDLAAAQINWGPKSAGIRAMARELNIGSDQMVFFDDNPVERAEVRMAAPEVLVADVPSDPLRYTEALTTLPWFDQIAVSDEDRRRTELYRHRREAANSQQAFASVDEFLASLDMTAQVGAWTAETRARIVQLIGKTNQFNLTTRRHSEADLAAGVSSGDQTVAWIRVADRFGDHGLIGVAILRAVEGVGIVDTFLMSCRVMNRRVEHALMSVVADHARRLGCHELRGEYIPTAKNGMVRDFYPALGFAPVDGAPGWFRCALEVNTLPWPVVIRRVEQPEAATSE